jgi:hypothetical protein
VKIPENLRKLRKKPKQEQPSESPELPVAQNQKNLKTFIQNRNFFRFQHQFFFKQRRKTEVKKKLLKQNIFPKSFYRYRSSGRMEFA